MTIASQFIPQPRNSKMQPNNEQEPPRESEVRTEDIDTKKTMKALSSRKSIIIPKLHLSGEVKTHFNIAFSSNPLTEDELTNTFPTSSSIFSHTLTVAYESIGAWPHPLKTQRYQNLTAKQTICGDDQIHGRKHPGLRQTSKRRTEYILKTQSLSY